MRMLYVIIVIMLSPVLKKAKTRNMGFGIFAVKPVPKGAVTCLECDRCARFSSPGELVSMTTARRKHILEYSTASLYGCFHNLA